MPSSPARLRAPPKLSPAVRTLRVEAAGLVALEETLSGDMAEAFERVCGLIDAARGHGRVIVSGMGKSGHIGAKIAATLASTGTPGFFVHPAEAGHGDLGMITPQDVLLALSWSGETAELRSIVFYSRRFKSPAHRRHLARHSTLARSADIAFVLPRVEEACPHGLAPTTSTMIQLALGDALAISLLERRGFTADEFFNFHPGGSLGANLAHVRDVMHTGERVPIRAEARRERRPVHGSARRPRSP